MDKIKSFQITELSLCGFKSFAEETHITFGNPTVITGGNGRGKSSLADAIAFAVTGLPFFGEKRIDRMHSDDNPELYIRMDFLDENRVPHTLIRTRQKNRMAINYDGYEIRQMDLNDMFGERDIFLSILNPLYFIEELGDSGKELLARYLPMIPQKTVMEQLSAESREVLKNLELIAPEGHLKRVRESIRELEKSILYLEGQQDMAAEQSRNRDATISVLTGQITALQDEIGKLEEKQFSGMDVASLQDELANLSARYSELAGDLRSDTGVEEQLLELNRKLGERKAAVYAPKYGEHIAETSAKVRDLALQYKKETALCAGIVPGFICPTCRRSVMEADIPAVQEAFRASVGEIVAQGRAQRAQLEELQELEKKSQDTFEQFKAEDIARMEQEISALRSGDPETDAAVRQAKDIHARIQQLTSDLEFGMLTPEEYDRLRECKTQIGELTAQLTATKNTQIPTASDVEDRIREAKNAIGEYESLAKCLVFYISKRAEMTFSQLKMNRVELSLYDVVKSTGEFKDAFKFTYNGRRYDRLSLSEKIRAGMEVAELFKRLTGRYYPTFVDNMESVDDLSNVRPTGQLIMAKCIANTDLVVKPVRPIVSAIQQAA